LPELDEFQGGAQCAGVDLAEGLEQYTSVWKTLGGVAVQSAGDDITEWAVEEQRWDIEQTLTVGHDAAGDRACCDEWAPEEGLAENQAHLVDIERRADVLVLQILWGRVLRCEGGEATRTTLASVA